MKTKFAGIEFKNHLVAASSPLTESAIRIKCCMDAGFGAAILKSAAPYIRTGEGYGRKVVYTEDGFYADSSFEREIMTLDEGLKLYNTVKHMEDEMLIIPSVSVASLDANEWLETCREYERQGAKLLQLDFFYLGTQTEQSGFYDMASTLLTRLTSELGCTVMPKLNPRMDFAKICSLLSACGIKHVSLLDSMRATPPEGSGLHADTTSYFGKKQLPYTVKCLEVAKKYGLNVCAGGGVCSPYDVNTLLAKGASLVQTASYVLTNGYSAVPLLLGKECNKTLTHSPWCDVKDTAQCDKCGGCKNGNT